MYLQCQVPLVSWNTQFGLLDTALRILTPRKTAKNPQKVMKIQTLFIYQRIILTRALIFFGRKNYEEMKQWYLHGQ